MALLERAVAGGNLQAGGGRQRGRKEEKKIRSHATVLFAGTCGRKAREGNTKRANRPDGERCRLSRIESGDGGMKNY